MGPIQAELSAPAPGLLAVAFLRSAECATARTLSAWESEEAMMDFVFGEAHLQAIGSVSEVSRGGSITGHWDANSFSAVGWEQVIRNYSHPPPLTPMLLN